MRWDKDYESGNVEDRRGESPVQGAGGLGLIVMLLMRFGWKGALVIGGLYFVVTRFVMPSASAPTGEEKPGPSHGRSFVGFVTDDVEKTWAALAPKEGIQYVPAKVVLYSGATATACGHGSEAQGPFYCPRDEKVYLDLAFFQELHDRFGAPGDFAQAYVIAHELGHHMQRLQGTTGSVEHAPLSAQKGAGHLSVRTELQADCFAGVWAHSAEQRQLLDPGDIDQGLRAAAAVGDDRLQKMSTGTVQPESWTHGSAEQRTRWFKRGYQSGDPKACDTFSAVQL